jgi:transcriptional regulator with XRE-family HTH domain
MGTIDRVELTVSDKLRDREYRRSFFEAGAKFRVQDRIRDIMKVRGACQLELAESCGMKPSAMSRVLSEGYASWSFKTLLRIADALDAELRVDLVLAEDVIAEFRHREKGGADSALADHAALGGSKPRQHRGPGGPFLPLSEPTEHLASLAERSRQGGVYRKTVIPEGELQRESYSTFGEPRE